MNSWLEQCAEGDWQAVGDPLRGTTIVGVNPPLTTGNLATAGGCRGGAVGAPIDPTAPLPVRRRLSLRAGGLVGEFGDLFIDFAGWASLEDGSGSFTAGDDAYIRSFYTAFFTQCNPAVPAEDTPATRTKPPVLPRAVTIYCEAAWTGSFTRLSIEQGLNDFATAPTTEGNGPVPDPALDELLVLTYYLFYPCTEPPPSSSQLSPGSPNLMRREGQWEAISFYFVANGGALDGRITDGSQLDLGEASTDTPNFIVLKSGDHGERRRKEPAAGTLLSGPGSDCGAGLDRSG